VKVFDDSDLAQHAHFDLMDFERVRPDRVFRVLKSWTVLQFKEEVLCSAFGVDDARKMRLRQFTRRKNATIRASKVVENEKQEIVQLQNKENRYFPVITSASFLLFLIASFFQ
jgi:hypothetical protein